MQFISNAVAAKRLGADFFQAAALAVAVSPVAALACTDQPAGPAIEAVFIEGAPIDRLLVSNRSNDGWQIKQLTWDLTLSAGKVIFDTSGSGAGVQVFQPFRQLNAEDTKRAGSQVSDESQLAVLAAQPTVTDGDQSLALEFQSFGPEQVFGMSIDVDDQVASREITVERNEMKGARLQTVFAHAQKPGQTLTAIFDDQARASSCDADGRASE